MLEAVDFDCPCGFPAMIGNSILLAALLGGKDGNMGVSKTDGPPFWESQNNYLAPI